MKKILPVLVLLAFIAFCYQFIVSCFITEHKVVYSLISSNQKHYTIEENYQKVDKKHYYSFAIYGKNKKKKYLLSIERDFNKQERVITDIKYYKKNQLECVFPIYKREHTYDAACLLDGKQVSPFYLIEQNNEDFSYIAKKFSDDGYDEIYYQKDIVPDKKGNLSVYYDYIPENYTFAVWNYRGIYLFNSKDFNKVRFLNSDHYENTLSSVVGKYYVTINTDNEKKQLNYYQIILYDMVENKKSVLDVDISQDSYFNGVSDGILYITDPKNEKQYQLDPNKKKIEEVETVYRISNGKLKDAGNDFFDSPKVDSLLVSNQNITKLYHTEDIKKNRNDYYFKTDDGKLYRIIQNDYQHPILLCQFDDIREWQVHEDGVSFIVDDTLYFYSDVYGLQPILINPEFKYNYKNIYSFIRTE